MITEMSLAQAVTMQTRKVDDSGKLPSSNVLMCRQWWNVCWIYGDQEKYYRYLYGSKKKSPNSSTYGGINRANGLKVPKISAATTTTTTTAVVTMQRENVTFQNSYE